MAGARRPVFAIKCGGLSAPEWPLCAQLRTAACHVAHAHAAAPAAGPGGFSIANPHEGHGRQHNTRIITAQVHADMPLAHTVLCV